jgi:hypothetical protein
MDKHIDTSEIGIEDMKKLMKMKIDDNTAPYDRQSIEYTNAMIDSFFKDVIEPNAENNKVNAVFASDAWNIYQEGKETEIMWELRNELYAVPKETMEYWKTVFELPVVDMLKLGRPSLLYGHEMLCLWYRRWLMEMKYQSFFSNPDPETWVRKKDDIHDFEKNKELCPIDIAKYTNKMHCIMKHVRSFKV